MKHIKFFLIVTLVSSVFISCDSDDEATSSPATGVVGAWGLIAYTVPDGESVSVLGGDEITQQFTQTGTDFEYSVLFTSAPNQLTATGSFTVDETTTFQGQTATQSITLLGDVPIGSWSLNGSTLSLVDQLGEVITVDVAQVNETSLIFNLDLTQVSDDTPGNPMISGNATYTFVRL